MQKFSGASRPFLLILPLKTAEISIFQTPKSQNFGRFAPIFFSSQGARVSIFCLSKSEKLWGALILNEKSPEMAGGAVIYICLVLS